MSMADKRKRASETSVSELDSSIEASNKPTANTKQKKKKGKVGESEPIPEVDISKELREINQKLSNVITKDDSSLKDAITDVINQMKDALLNTVEKKIEFLEGKLFERDQDNDKLKAKITELENKIDSAADKQAQQKSNSQLLEEKQACKLNDLEQYGRRNNIRITGVAEENNELSNQTANVIVNTMNRKIPGLELKTSDIDIAHRLGRHDNGKPRAIIVKFISRSKKKHILRNRKSFKGSNIYINEDLTHLNQQVFMCIKRNINREYEKVWIRDGKLFFSGRDGQIQPIQFRDYRTWAGGLWNTILAGVYHI